MLTRTKASLALLALLVGSAAGRESMQEPARKDVCQVAEVLSSKVRLNNGVEMPRIAFGTAGLGDATEEAVSLALEAGYRSVDTAQATEWYWEDAVGRVVKQVTKGLPSGGSDVALERPDQAGSSICGEAEREGGEMCDHDAHPARPLSREEIFLTTKIHPRDFSSGRLRAMFETSKSNLDGVDLLLLHAPYCWPGSCPDSPTPWQEAWRTLEELYAEGNVRAIGVSNFPERLLRELLEMARITPAVVQNWMDPFHHDRAVRSLCAEQGIVFVAYSTLGGQWRYRLSPPQPNPVSTNGILRGIAEDHGTTPQAVALSWALQSGALILPRSSNARRIRDNLSMFSAADNGDCTERLAAELATGIDPTRENETNIAVFLSQEEMEVIVTLDGTMGN